jgi:WD40 repeat protein
VVRWAASGDLLASLGDDWIVKVRSGHGSGPGGLHICAILSTPSKKLWGTTACTKTYLLRMLRLHERSQWRSLDPLPELSWCACAPLLSFRSQLWRLSQDSPVAVFKHDQEVFTIKWSPAPAAEGQGQLLATTSLDKSVRLFDTQSGRWVWLPVATD